MSSALETKSDFHLVEIDQDHAKATSGNLLFMVWRGQTLVAAYRRGIQLVKQLADQFPAGVGVIQVVEVDAVPPDSDARKAFADLLRVDHIAHFSVTHEGEGFKAAAVRAIVSGGQALARPTFPHVVHASMSDAATWHAGIQRSLGFRTPPAQIERVVRQLRSELATRFPR